MIPNQGGYTEEEYNFSDSSIGSQTAKNGLKYELFLASKLCVNSLANKNEEDLKWVKPILASLKIEIKEVSVVYAYRLGGRFKTDIKLVVIFKNNSDKVFNISLKGSPNKTQFNNIKIDDFNRHIQTEEAKLGYKYFFGHESLVKDIHMKLKSRHRPRLFKTEIEINQRTAMISDSANLNFIDFILNCITGHGEDKVDLIIGPKTNWSKSPEDMLVINVSDFVNKVMAKFSRVKHLFIENDDSCIDSNTPVVYTKVTLDEKGKYEIPPGASTIKFCDNLITIKRKGSEKSREKGFNPSDIQVVASIKKMYEYVYGVL